MLSPLLLSAILTFPALQEAQQAEGPQGLRVSPADSWSGFRGAGSGHSAAEDLPTSWSEEDNLAWSLPLAGQGQSSPIIRGGRVFVTSIRGAQKEHCIVTCASLSSGERLWQRTFAASQGQELSAMVSQAAPTPVADDERIYAFFESGDLFVLDHDGQLLWERALVPEYGAFEGNHGVGSSPLLVGDSLVLLLDHAGPSYLLALDPATGSNRWKLDRSPRVSWSTPVLHAREGRHELVISSNGSVDGVDPSSGEVLWSVGEMAGNTVPSPTVWDDAVLVAASKGVGCRLLRHDSSDPAPRLVWSADGARPSGFGSPLVLGDRAYLVNKSGSLFVLNLADGTVAAEADLPEGCWASPLTAMGLIYAFCKDGTTLVLRPGSAGVETVAENSLPCESTVYGAALAGGSVVLREASKLWCLRQAPE